MRKYAKLKKEVFTCATVGISKYTVETQGMNQLQDTCRTFGL